MLVKVIFVESLGAVGCKRFFWTVFPFPYTTVNPGFNEVLVKSTDLFILTRITIKCTEKSPDLTNSDLTTYSL